MIFHLAPQKNCLLFLMVYTTIFDTANIQQAWFWLIYKRLPRFIAIFTKPLDVHFNYWYISAFAFAEVGVSLKTIGLETFHFAENSLSPPDSKRSYHGNWSSPEGVEQQPEPPRQPEPERQPAVRRFPGQPAEDHLQWVPYAQVVDPEGRHSQVADQP